MFPLYFITWLKENVPSDSLEESALAAGINNGAGEVPWYKQYIYTNVYCEARISEFAIKEEKSIVNVHKYTYEQMNTVI
jgi:hypothetical protein